MYYELTITKKGMKKGNRSDKPHSAINVKASQAPDQAKLGISATSKKCDGA